jgi:1-acyl-sn-glycerol-3-phosphate acyltransferase
MGRRRRSPNLYWRLVVASHEFDYGKVTYGDWPFLQRLSRRILVAMLRCLVELEVEGLENVPDQGPFILAANHLHVLDPAIGLLLVPRRMVGVVKEKWRRPPFGWLLAAMSDVVYVGRSNRRALDEAARVLGDGGVVAILPEGTRSPTGALLRGRRGMALLAARAGVPILPAASYGQEQAAHWWRRLKRVPVRVRIGDLVDAPSGPLDRDGLQSYADRVMLAIANLLPSTYRGVYGGERGPA